MSMENVAVIGTGMTRFGKHQDFSLKTLGGEAIRHALADAGLEASDIDAAFVANAMAGITTGQVSIVGQTILEANGFHSIPVFNIDNACASSSSALHLAVQYIRAGAADTVLVLGAEKLICADRTKAYIALNGAADIDFVAANDIDVTKASIFVSAVYPPRLEAYQQKFGLDAQTLAQIAVKNRNHAAHNPNAQFTTPLTVDEVLGSRQIVGPITALMCAPIGDGASAVIVTRERLVRKHQRPVWIRGSVIMMASAAGAATSVARTAAKAYTEARITPAAIDVAEVHDSISFNELLAYEELGLCEPGRGAALFQDGATTLGGRVPVNPSGGLESRGHPVAATGTAQIHELVSQLRGEAGLRQVKGAKVAVAENAGGFTGTDTAAIAITVLEA
ncbi:thiolase family protein [Pusillimonas noertemannii]|uniref:thiolase family protein n=1 Tax=Pusillimonas noertemannii TaxID=305977 RepID=UPI0002FAF02E|nr:thiolase family protein [Pusillimonas noertemannii]